MDYVRLYLRVLLTNPTLRADAPLSIPNPLRLMIGESVLSLLINATTEERDYYIIALIGILTVIILMAIKFESQPSHAYEHALWQNMRNATCFSLLMQLLSMSLISFGVSYKIFLTSVLSETEDSDKTRRLAPSPTVSDQASATLFCVSLAIVLTSIELTMLTHNGIQRAYGRLFRDLETRTLHIPLVMLTLFKVCTILFLCTVSTWTTDPMVVTLIGFGVVVLVAITSFLGWGFVNHGDFIEKLVGMTTSKIFVGAKKALGQKVSFATGNKRNTGQTNDAKNFSAGGSESGSQTTDRSASLHPREDIYDEMFDAVVVTDLDGSILKVNRTTLEVFGYNFKEELIGENVSTLVGGGDAKHHDLYLSNFRKKDKESSQIGKQRVLHAKRKDGTEFPCIVGIKKSANNKYLVGYIRDMTGVGESNGNGLSISNVKQLDAINRVIDDTSFDSIIVIDSDAIIQSVNSTTCTDFGYDTKEDLVGQNIKILIGGGMSEKHDAMVKNFFDKSYVSRVLGNQRVLQAKRKDGSEFKCIIGIHMLDGTKFVVGYIRNIDCVFNSTKKED